LARATLLNIHLIEDKHGVSFLASVGIHAASVALLLLVPYLLPRPAVIQLRGSGPGGGVGGDSYAVGIADELGGGAGMTKPAVNPQPPALPADTPAKEEPKTDAVSLPDTPKPPKTPKVRPRESTTATKATTEPKTNVIPTAPQPGAGGTGGVGGGSGGGRGGGIGVSIGSGSGGVGDHWYARTVEMAFSRNWSRPNAQVHIV
jgi:protein TonB